MPESQSATLGHSESFLTFKHFRTVYKGFFGMFHTQKTICAHWSLKAAKHSPAPAQPQPCPDTDTHRRRGQKGPQMARFR